MITVKVQPFATIKGLLHGEISRQYMARVRELCGDVMVSPDQAAENSAQALWEFHSQGLISTGDLCLLAGRLAAINTIQGQTINIYESVSADMAGVIDADFADSDGELN